MDKKLSTELEKLIALNKEPYSQFPNDLKLNNIKKELHHRINQLISWQPEIQSKTSSSESQSEVLQEAQKLLSLYQTFLTLKKFSQRSLQLIKTLNRTMLCLIRPSILSPFYRILQNNRFSPLQSSLMSNASILTNIFGISFESFSSVVSDIKFLEKSQTIVLALYDKTIRIWSLAGKQLKILIGHQHFVEKIEVSQNEKFLISCSHDKSAIIWSLSTYKPLKKLELSASAILDVILTKDQKFFVYACGDGIIQIWFWDRFAEAYKKDTSLEIDYYTSFNYCSKVKCMESSWDGKTLFVSGTGTDIKVWDLETQSLKATLKGHKELVLCLKLLKQRDILLSSGQDCKLILWDLKDYSILVTIETVHREYIKSIVLTEDENHAVLTGRDTFFSMIDLKSGDLIKKVNLAQGYVNAALIRNSNEVVLCEENVTGIDLNTGETTFRIAGNYCAKLELINVCHYRKYCLGMSTDLFVRFWSLDDGEIKFVKRLRVKPSSICYLNSCKYFVFALGQTEVHVVRMNVNLK